MASNLSKPYQAQLIRRVGFRTPPTLVTNDPEHARGFARANGSKVIFKSISSARSIVSRIEGERQEKLDRVSHLPTQFQRLIEGVDIRVHVIGSRVFATEVASSAIDYRYAGRDDLDVTMRPFALPAEIDKRCLALAKLLQLPFCGIDLLRTKAGDYFCFEVNPSPGYSYYENATEQEISAALINYLSGQDS
jgi:glutathione synthase/RimK-type ligase-like ATP-grasp enzyme